MKKLVYTVTDEGDGQGKAELKFEGFTNLEVMGLFINQINGMSEQMRLAGKPVEDKLPGENKPRIIKPY